MRVVGWSLALISFATSSVIFCFDTSFARSLSANAKPLSRAACCESTRRKRGIASFPGGHKSYAETHLTSSNDAQFAYFEGHIGCV